MIHPWCVHKLISYSDGHSHNIKLQLHHLSAMHVCSTIYIYMSYVRWVRWVDAFVCLFVCCTCSFTSSSRHCTILTPTMSQKVTLRKCFLEDSLWYPHLWCRFFFIFFNGPEYFSWQRMEERIRSSWDDQSTRNWLKLNFDEFRQTIVVRIFKWMLPY